jgi:hypothetical protein
MSLLHNFHFTPATENEYVRYLDYCNLKPDASIHDNVIRYMNDTLLWVPSIHLSGGKLKRTQGLSLYGATTINNKGILMFNHVIDSWLKLFSESPKIFELNGGITVNADNTVGDWYIFEVRRDDLVRELEILHRMGQEVLAGNHVILHLGI